MGSSRTPRRKMLAALASNLSGLGPECGFLKSTLSCKYTEVFVRIFYYVYCILKHELHNAFVK